MTRSHRRLEEDLQFARFRATGAPAALERVYDLTSVALFRTARRMVFDRATAEDLLQQTFLLAIQNAHSYDVRRPLLPWLLAILTNEAHRTHRQAARRLERDRLEKDGYRLLDPTTCAANTELLANVEAAIQRLPRRYHAVLRLRLLHGQPHAVIAQTLHRPVATVRTQLMRGLEQLRKLLPVGIAGAVFTVPAPAAATSLARIRAAVCERAALRTRPVTIPPAAGRWVARVACAAAVAIPTTLLAWSQADLPGPVQPHDPVRRTRAAAETVTPSTVSLASHRIPVTTPPAIVHAGLELRLQFADGRPASLVWASLQSLRRANPYLTERWVQVDARGRALLTGLTPGLTSVVVDRGGRQSIELSADRPQALTIVIPPGKTIEGRAVDADGAGVPHARIWLSDDGDQFSGHEVATADADGRFALESVGGDRYVGARADSFAASPLQRANASRSLRVVLRHGGARLTGIVQDRAGQPVPNATVFAGTRTYRAPVRDIAGRPMPAWAPLTTTTDDAGRFELDGIPPEKVLVTARAAGHVGATHSVTAAAGSASHVVLTLHRGALTGRVTDAAGRAIAGAHVGCWDVTRSWRTVGVTTDSDGRYRLEDFDYSRPTVWADGGRKGVLQRRFDLSQPGVELRWDPVLAEVRDTVHGVLCDANGTALGGWTLHARTGSPTDHPMQTSTVSDPQGGFRFPFLANVEYAVVAVPPGGMFPCRPGVMVRPAPHARTLRVPAEAMPTATVAGRIVDENDRAVEGATVSLSNTSWVPRSGLGSDHLWLQPDASGCFAQPEIPPGEYRVVIYAPGHTPLEPPAFQLAADKTCALGVLRMLPRAE